MIILAVNNAKFAPGCGRADSHDKPNLKNAALVYFLGGPRVGVRASRSASDKLRARRRSSETNP